MIQLDLDDPKHPRTADEFFDGLYLDATEEEMKSIEINIREFFERKLIEQKGGERRMIETLSICFMLIATITMIAHTTIAIRKGKETERILEEYYKEEKRRLKNKRTLNEIREGYGLPPIEENNKIIDVKAKGPEEFPAEVFYNRYQKDQDFRKAVKASILSAITDTKGSCSDEQLAENIANRLFGES